MTSQLAEAFGHDKNCHGAVHGGRIVLSRYLVDGILAYNPHVLAGGEHTTVTVALGVLSLTQVAHIHGMHTGKHGFRATTEFATLLHEMWPGMPDPLPRNRP